MPTEPAPNANRPAPELPVPTLVLDTSILIMAVTRRRSKHRWLRDAWHDRRIIPLISEETQNEFQRTLRKPSLRIPGYLIPELETDYLDYCTKLTVAEPPIHAPQCRDPKDQPFLDLAYYAAADYLVTGDDDLLSLRDSSLVRIVQPEQLQAIFR